MKPDSYELALEKGKLHVSGERKSEIESSDQNFFRREIQRGSFDRNVQLPDHKYNSYGIQAKYEDGVLKVYIPKQA